MPLLVWLALGFSFEWSRKKRVYIHYGLLYVLADGLQCAYIAVGSGECGGWPQAYGCREGLCELIRRVEM